MGYTEVPDTGKILEIAKKYYEWAEPMIKAGRPQFNKAVNWSPKFDGKKKDHRKASSLSCDTAMVGTLGGMGTMTVALACAAFDLAFDTVKISQNLGCAIAIFCDNNDDPDIIAKEKEIYEDAVTVLIYALSLSMVGSIHTEASLGPLVALGNLYMDMERYEEAKELFMTARRIDELYMPALNGLAAYYKATNKPQFAVMIKTAAKSNPTTLGKSLNKIGENNKKAEKIFREGAAASDEELEKEIDKAEEIEAPNYGDIFDGVDPKNAEKMRKNRKDLNNRMKIKIPNIHILTAFTDINKDNQISVKCAAEAVSDELKHLQKYIKALSRGSGNTAADAFENTGIGDFKFMGMDFHEFIRDASNNPAKYENMDTRDEVHLRTDNLDKYIKELKDGLGEITAARHGMEGGDRFGRKFSRAAAKANLLLFPFSLDPLKYANMWDVFIQQCNIPLYIKKKALLDAYMMGVMRKSNETITDIQRNFSREYAEIHEAYDAKMEDLKERYDREVKACGDNSGCTSAAAKRYELNLHKLHLEYYPQLNQCTKRYWLEGTACAAIMYGKLERNIPRMYKEVMKHLVYISDEKVRAEQEDMLVGGIASTLTHAIGLVLSTYGGGEILRIEMCGCDPERMEQLTKELQKEKEEKDAEMQQRQKAAENAFKNGIIDENSSYYKDYVKKWEYEIDLVIFKYRSNDYFTTGDVSIPTPVGSIDASSFRNNITQESRVSADVTIGGEIGPVELKATFGISVAWDANGRMHPEGFDLRAGLEASTGVGPLSATAGVSASLERGTKVYGEVTLSGNDYIDEMKERALGEEFGGLAPEMDNTIKLWTGDYVITDKN
ncbi:MAG: tetratricopeptide repeat protein [Methanomassiliicoccaceae archaeon]|jgi:tetratricopeptide (TPR) repeat protein|nr:tetratricopeptide repeat protein [Methanomassiliicoccaceae archaeon]